MLRAVTLCVSDIESGSSVPNPVFEAIWSKALQLTRCDGAIARAPGYPPHARTVKSSLKSGLHLVIPGPGGKFTCDWPNYHSLNVCSPSVAIAEVNGKLEQFTQWYRKSKKLPSLT